MTEWEQHYLDQNTPWDKGNAHPALVDALQFRQLEGSILVPGCGAGHDARALAVANLNAEIVGLDIAPSAIERAETYPKKGQERFVAGDLFDLPEDFQDRFDWVVEHTCFCAIDPIQREAYVNAVHGALKPGGQLLGIFYLNPYDEEHQPEDDRPPYGIEREALMQHFAGGFEVMESWIPEQTFSGREQRELVVLMRRKA